MMDNQFLLELYYALKALLFWLGFLFIYILICSWVYRDSRKLGKSPGYALAVFLMAFFMPIVGFMIYLVIRKA